MRARQLRPEATGAARRHRMRARQLRPEAEELVAVSSANAADNRWRGCWWLQRNRRLMGQEAMAKQTEYGDACPRLEVWKN